MEQKQKMFSKDDVSYTERTLLTQHTTTISLIKQNMHLIMSNNNHCWFILTILLTTIQQKH